MDIEYVSKRLALIPIADKTATARVRAMVASGMKTRDVYVESDVIDPITKKKEPFRWSFHTQFFHEEMEKLVKNLL